MRRYIYVKRNNKGRFEGKIAGKTKILVIADKASMGEMLEWAKSFGYQVREGDVSEFQEAA